MKNHDNAPKKKHHEKTCVANLAGSHSAIQDKPIAESATPAADLHTKAKSGKKH